VSIVNAVKPVIEASLTFASGGVTLSTLATATAKSVGAVTANSAVTNTSKGLRLVFWYMLFLSLVAFPFGLKSGETEVPKAGLPVTGAN